MKNKIVVTLLLIISLAIGAEKGIETYSKFISRATSEEDNTIKLGKVEINNKRDNVNLGTWIDSSVGSSKIRMPGDEVSLTPIEIRNTGDLDMLIKPTIELSFVKESIDESGTITHPTVDDLSMFKIMPIVSGTADSIGELGLFDEIIDNDGYVTLKEFETAINNNAPILTRPNETITMGGLLILSEYADNEYQGASVTANLIVTGEQALAPAPVPTQESAQTVGQ